MKRPVTIQLPYLTKAQFDSLPQRVLQSAGSAFESITASFLEHREAAEQQVASLPRDLRRAIRAKQVTDLNGAVQFLREWAKVFMVTFNHGEPVEIVVDEDAGELPEAPVEVVVDEEAKS